MKFLDYEGTKTFLNNISQEDWKEVTKEWADNYYPNPDNYV